MARILALACLVAVLLVAMPGTAHAYIDPTAGSVLLQLLLGGVAGLLVVGKLCWRRIAGLFQPKKREHDDG